LRDIALDSNLVVVRSSTARLTPDIIVTTVGRAFKAAAAQREADPQSQSKNAGDGCNRGSRGSRVLDDRGRQAAAHERNFSGHSQFAPELADCAFAAALQRMMRVQ
jgi:hypothetical protein